MSPKAPEDPTGGAYSILVSRLRLLASIAFDGLFLVAWLLLLKVLDWLERRIGTTGDLEWQVAKWLLTIGTIGLVALYVFWDLRTAARTFRKGFQNHQADRLTDLGERAANEGGG